MLGRATRPMSSKSACFGWSSDGTCCMAREFRSRAADEGLTGAGPGAMLDVPASASRLRARPGSPSGHWGYKPLRGLKAHPGPPAVGRAAVARSVGPYHPAALIFWFWVRYLTEDASRGKLGASVSQAKGLRGVRSTGRGFWLARSPRTTGPSGSKPRVLSRRFQGPN